MGQQREKDNDSNNNPSQSLRLCLILKDFTKKKKSNTIEISCRVIHFFNYLIFTQKS